MLNPLNRNRTSAWQTPTSLWRRANQAHYRFWRSQADGIWEVGDAQHIRLSASGDPYLKDLHQYQVSGGFTPEIYTVLRSQPQLLERLVQDLLQRNFPVLIYKNII